MAIKNLYEVYLVEHNDDNLSSSLSSTSPIVNRSVYVLAKNPSQANSKVIRKFGDKLLFIENIRFAGTNNEEQANVSGVVTLVT